MLNSIFGKSIRFRDIVRVKFLELRITFSNNVIQLSIDFLEFDEFLLSCLDCDVDTIAVVSNSGLEAWIFSVVLGVQQAQ